MIGLKNPEKVRTTDFNWVTAAMSFHWSSAVLNSFDWLANQIRPV